MSMSQVGIHKSRALLDPLSVPQSPPRTVLLPRADTEHKPGVRRKTVGEQHQPLQGQQHPEAHAVFVDWPAHS
jgi:hypothetical protein